MKNFITNITKIFSLQRKDVQRTTAMPTPIAASSWNKALWSSFKLQDYFKDGYSNPYIYRALNLIISAFTAINIYPQDENGEDITDNNLLQLLRQPNPMQSWQMLTEEILLYYFLGGAGYIMSVEPDGTTLQAPSELYAISPLHLTIKPPSRLGDVAMYVYKPQNTQYIIDAMRVCEFKNQNPLNKFDAFPPIKPADKSIDTNNYYLQYVKNVMANDGIPPAFLTTEQGFLSDEQRRELKDSFYNRTGKRLLALDGGVKLQPLGWSPKELSIGVINQMTIKDICVVLGVSPILLGDASQSTYSNYVSARAQLYTEVVIPLSIKFYSQLSKWLTNRFQAQINIKIDIDSIEALNVAREAKWQSVISGYNAGVVTLNEAREALGYSLLEEGDTFKTQEENITEEESVTKQYIQSETKSAKRRIILKPASKHRKLMRKLTAETTQKITKFFSENADEIIKDVLIAYSATQTSKATASEKRIIDNILHKLNMKPFAKLAPDIQYALSEIMRDAIQINLKTLKPANIDELLSLLNIKAEEFAKQRAAELVGMKWVDGRLIENPNPRWAITDTTREQLRETITNAYNNNLSVQELAKQIRLENFAFSKERAEMIARTELARSDVYGNIETWKECGVKYKQWLLAGEPCADCIANADAGVIAMDEEFPNGDVPVHPNCECDIVAVIEKE